jgi:hypothetical protein
MNNINTYTMLIEVNDSCKDARIRLKFMFYGNMLKHGGLEDVTIYTKWIDPTKVHKVNHSLNYEGIVVTWVTLKYKGKKRTFRFSSWKEDNVLKLSLDKDNELIMTSNGKYLTRDRTMEVPSCNLF